MDSGQQAAGQRAGQCVMGSVCWLGSVLDRVIDCGQQGGGRRTAGTDSVAVDPESESTAWFDCHEERSDSITSFQSGGRVSFSVRPSVSSRPSQFDDAGDVDVSQYAADTEKVCLHVRPSVVKPLKIKGQRSNVKCVYVFFQLVQRVMR